jgi:hypothetical protein
VITIFAIVGASDPEKLGEALNDNFAGNYIQIPRGANYFVVASPQIAVTAKQISDKLGITDGSNGSAVVLNVAGYYGRTDPEIWEWLAAKLQQVE